MEIFLAVSTQILMHESNEGKTKKINEVLYLLLGGPDQPVPVVARLFASHRTMGGGRRGAAGGLFV